MCNIWTGAAIINETLETGCQSPGPGVEAPPRCDVMTLMR